jgi:hypothetical protein
MRRRRPTVRCSGRSPAALLRMRPLRYYINVTLDGCCDHRGKEVRRVEHPAPGRLERGVPRAGIVRGAIEAAGLEAREPAGVRLGAVAMRYEPPDPPLHETTLGRFASLVQQPLSGSIVSQTCLSRFRYS